MIRYVAAHNEGLMHQADAGHGGHGGKALRVSVELEKKKPELVELIPLADVVSTTFRTFDNTSWASKTGDYILSVTPNNSSPRLSAPRKKGYR